MPFSEPLTSLMDLSATQSDRPLRAQEQEMKHGLQETNKLLVEVVDGIQKVGRILVASQNSMAKVRDLLIILITTHILSC